MSYDLYFRAQTSATPLTRERFMGYFNGRKYYQVDPSQAVYSNQHSGVYFLFEYRERGNGPGAEDEADPSLLPVSFNLNYFRPHPFGLEAEPEVAAFVREFELTVSDPQLSGMGEGEYSAEGFLQGWNAGNALAYQAGLLQSDQPLLTLPSSRIRALWRWNVDVDARQAEVGESVFVPSIMFLNAGDRVETCVAWTDGIPVLLPVIDRAFVPRQHFAPKRWFRSTTDFVLIPWAELESIVRNFPKRSGDPEAYELFYGKPPADVERMIRERKPPALKPKGISFDRVLDRELLEQAGA